MRTEYTFYTTHPVLAYSQLRFLLESIKDPKDLADELLHFDAVMYQNLGKESKGYQRRAVKRTSKIIYAKLRELDEKYSTLFVD